jgi:hypothetical protein
MKQFPFDFFSKTSHFVNFYLVMSIKLLSKFKISDPLAFYIRVSSFKMAVSERKLLSSINCANPRLCDWWEFLAKILSGWLGLGLKNLKIAVFFHFFPYISKGF